MRVDKAVTAITTYIPQNVFEETVHAVLPALLETFEASDVYALRVAYALAACDQISNTSISCVWYDALWAWARENCDPGDLDGVNNLFSSAYVDSIKVTTGKEKLRVEIELPASLSGADNVEEKLAHLMKMMSGAETVKPVESDPENGRFRFDFEGVNAKDVINLLIKSLAAISGVLAIIDSTEIGDDNSFFGKLRKQATLARMLVLLFTLIVGVITGQVTSVDDANDILDGTPIVTLEPDPTDAMTPTHTHTPTGTPEKPATMTPVPTNFVTPTSVVDPYPVASPTATTDPYPGNTP